MTEVRKIAVFTGNRAEYGLQFPILRAFAADPRVEQYLLAGGAHLQQDFGQTMAEIEADGFSVYRRVEIEMQQDTLYATAQAIGTGVLSVSRILAELQPDVVVIYADRFESLAAMVASTQMNIPTAHIEGGDYTEGGALDDSVRHAMTKLAHLHFTTNDEASQRVRRLGEEPWRVHTVGYPALDLIAAGMYASPDEVIARLGLDIERPVVLFCQHSVTTEADAAEAQIRHSLAALSIVASEGFQVIVTYPNNDAGGRRIIGEIERWQGRGILGVRVVKSLGRSVFHGVMSLIGREGRGAYAGNSSAGIKETPIFGTPAINIGSRQQGRLRGTNVIDVGYDTDAIVSALHRSAEDAAFRKQCRECDNPYGAGDAGRLITEVLSTIPLDARLLQKKMTF
jgi:UDP-hydrolysing UDP-N-acetyl-D-glucosamine 2-epimerase